MTINKKPTIVSPYTRIGPKLVDMGYSAMPVLPGAKFPGKRSFGDWIAESGWQRYCDRLPTDREIKIWSTWDEAGVCIALGFNNVVAVDIDTTDDAETEAILSVLPESPVGKTGAKGRTFFYRANVERTDPETGEVTGIVKSKPFDIYKSRVVDLLCHGRQTVLPPSVHPDTGREYIWTTEDTLEHVSPEDLPMLPDDIAARLAVVLTPLGYLDVPDVPLPRRGEDGPSDTPWGEVNMLARDNFDAWVPALGLPAMKRNRNGTYRAAAVWRGGDGPNVSFHPKGIKDMKADRGHSPLDIVMLATGSPLDAALRWLAPRVGYVPQVGKMASAIIATAARKRAAADAAEDMPQPQSPSGTEMVAVSDDAPPKQQEEEMDLEAFTRPGGFVEDMVDWIVSSSSTPSRVLALSAVLPLVGALIGRRYSTGDRDTRANLYVAALAGSGYGKDHARQQIKRFIAAGYGLFDKFSGPARIMSASALRETLEKTPSVLCMVDEFGGFVKDITDRYAGSHQRAISADLRDYYSASSTFFEGAAYRGTPAKKIHHPMLCLYGTSTPEQFWNALCSASAEDGLLPRIVLFYVPGDDPQTAVPSTDIRKVPSELLQVGADIAGIDAQHARNHLAKASPRPADDAPARLVPWDDGAKRVFEMWADRVRDESAMTEHEARPFIRRILETATKLALIVAVANNPKSPLVTGDNMEWAAGLAWACTQTMIKEAGERMSDNMREANYKRIQNIIRKAGSEGVTPGRLADRLKGVDARQRDEILKDLTMAGKVIQEIGGTKGRPKNRYLWV